MTVGRPRGDNSGSSMGRRNSNVCYASEEKQSSRRFAGGSIV